MQGSLTVTEPDAYLATLKQGLGRAKAFGCGLMLIRRA
ncbi:type I-E CRISPR-associated protein Cas6/Cse3/CasE [Thiolapillus sp.]|nr:type I-E CRISPR-associated protein Cas6/Cse3/CasE [Thiolapillus sp.]